MDHTENIERRRCLTCYHWNHTASDEEGEEYGECRVSGPQIGPKGIDCGDELLVIGCWPVTKTTDFCGQYAQQRSNIEPSEN